MRLTKQFCKRVTRAEGRLHWDDSFPSLGVRVGTTGKKSWVVRIKNRYKDTIVTLGDALEMPVADAKRAAMDEIDASKRGGAVDFTTWSTRWIGGKRVATRTLSDYKKHLEDLRRMLGRKGLREIARRDVAWIRDELADRRGVTQANRTIACLSSCMTAAMEADLVDFNPCTGVKRIPTQPRERRLSVTELHRVLEAIEDEPNRHYRAMWFTILYTGCRPGEARGMTWSSIDLEAREWRLATTKNKRPHVIPLSAPLVGILGSLPRIAGYVFPCSTNDRKPISGSSKLWARMLARTGDEEAGVAPVMDLRMHDLRRSAASLLLDEGKDLKFIGGLLNHKSQATTEIYARLGAPAKREAVEILADVLEKHRGAV